MDIFQTIFLYGVWFAFGWGVILFLLWIRPEYQFLIFYVIANLLLVFLIGDIWLLTWAEAPWYALDMLVAALIMLAAGAPIVALFKWLKTRKTGRDKELDKEMERIRAEISARDGQPPTVS